MSKEYKQATPIEAISPYPKVYCLRMHQAATIKGITEASLYAHKDVEMTWRPDGVWGEYKGVKFIVPHANVVVAFLTNNEHTK